jgi:selenium metabolism protein YedF
MELKSTIRKDLVLKISTDCLGQGDYELGRALMKSYIYALTEAVPKPGTILFINRGIFLATEGSEVLESLKILENEGVDILSCGTCLKFYEMDDKLIVGKASNMFAIVEKMNNAGNTIVIG